jgi:predicted phage terminase large subunit-like protein
VIQTAIEPFLMRRAEERDVYAWFEWLTPVADKHARGRAFQARAAMQKVIFPWGQAWAERVINQCVSFPGGAHDDAFDVMAWMCLAIANAHPAIVLEVEEKKRRGDYQKAKNPNGGWRTA